MLLTNFRFLASSLVGLCLTTMLSSNVTANSDLVQHERQIANPLSERIREQMVAICSNPNLAALHSSKEQMMKTILATLLAPPVAPNCEMVKCDLNLFNDRALDCSKVFACSRLAKELTCMTKNTDRMSFSLKNIDPKTYEEFANNYLQNTSKYSLYLSNKKPEFFKCELGGLKISENKTLPEPELSEKEFQSFHEADKLIHNEIETKNFDKNEIESIKDQKSLKQFLTKHFYSSDPKNERRFLGYMLQRPNIFGNDFKLSDYLNDGKLYLGKIQDTLDLAYASSHCEIRKNISVRLQAALKGEFSPVTEKDRELIREIMRFKEMKRNDEDTINGNFDNKIGQITQACLLESAALESYLGVDRRIEEPTVGNLKNRAASYDFAQAFDVDPFNAGNISAEAESYTRSYSRSSFKSLGADYDEGDSSTIRSVESLKADPSISNQNNNVNNPFNQFQAQPLSPAVQSFNDIFNSMSDFSYIPQKDTPLFDKKVADKDETSNSIENFIPKPFEQMSYEDLIKLKDQTQKEIQDRNQSLSGELDTKDKVMANAETSLLKKRLAELEKRLKERDQSNDDEKVAWKTNAGNPFERKFRDSSRESHAFSDSQASKSPGSTNTSYALVPDQTTSNSATGQGLGLKLVTNKQSLSLGNQDYSAGEQALVNAKINPIMLDYIYQTITANNLEAFILETSPGQFMEVTLDKGADGKPKLDKLGKPLFSLKPIKDKNKYGPRKISSLPDPSKIKRSLKEIDDARALTRQMELNRLLKKAQPASP